MTQHRSTEIQNQEVWEKCRTVLKKHARSFRWASLFLSARDRDDAAVIYTFCRIVDDAVDEAESREQAETALVTIQTDLHRSRPDNPLIALFLEVTKRHNIELNIIDHLIMAVSSDLGPVRIGNEAELMQYAYGVAGTVGLMMCGLLGVEDRRAYPHAVDLGIGMQLTNICRDVLEDLNRDRVYLPATYLQKVGASQQDLVNGIIEPEKISLVVKTLLDSAENYYQSAEFGMRYLPVRPRLAIIISSRLYRAIGLRLLQKFGGSPLGGRTVVPWYEKLGCVFIGIIVWFGSLVSRMKIPRHNSALHLHLKGLPGTSS